jgi:hypothetical protein
MGPGCQSVTRTSTPDADLVVGRWRDGPPVSAEETLEVPAFMEAADLSKKEGGRPVNLAGSPER